MSWHLWTIIWVRLRHSVHVQSLRQLPAMRASQLVRRIVTVALVVYFASRIINSYLKLQRRSIGTLFNRIISNTVQGGNLYTYL